MHTPALGKPCQAGQLGQGSQPILGIGPAHVQGIPLRGKRQKRGIGLRTHDWALFSLSAHGGVVANQISAFRPPVVLA